MAGQSLVCTIQIRLVLRLIQRDGQADPTETHKELIFQELECCQITTDARPKTFNHLKAGILVSYIKFLGRLYHDKSFFFSILLSQF